MIEFSLKADLVQPIRIHEQNCSITKEESVKQLSLAAWRLRLWKDTKGQDTVEYALIAGLVAVIAVAAMPALSTVVSNVYSKIGSIIESSVH
jgi:pilus assembly protein Flp/PilA